MRLSVVIYGVPQTKGSAKAFVPKSWARAAAVSGTTPRAVVTNDNPKAKEWQERIADGLREVLTDHHQPFADGPVVLEVWFYFPRPQKYLTRKYADVDVPHLTRPDSDKCIRVVKDALSRVFYRDDAQVVDLAVHKRYCAAGEAPRAEITVQSGSAKLAPQRDASTAPTLFGEEGWYASEA